MLSLTECRADSHYQERSVPLICPRGFLMLDESWGLFQYYRDSHLFLLNFTEFHLIPRPGKHTEQTKCLTM